MSDRAWRRLGVDAFVLSPGRRPPGVVTTPLAEATDRIDPAGGAFTATVELIAGLRAVEFDLLAPFATPVEVDVVVAGRLVVGHALVLTGSPVVVPIEGDPLVGPATVTVRVLAEEGTATLGVDDNGVVVVGVIGSDGGGTLVTADGLSIVHRPVSAVTDAGDADVVINRVDDRRLQFTVESAQFVEMWTDIVHRPGWTALVNGAPGELQGDVVLGVRVPPGVSEVDIRYRPPGLTLGLALIAMTVLAWLLSGLVVAGRRSLDHRDPV